MSGAVLNRQARQLILIFLVAACGRAQWTFGQTVVPGGLRTIEQSRLRARRRDRDDEKPYGSRGKLTERVSHRSHRASGLVYQGE
jgi:hypothetical protein